MFSNAFTSTFYLCQCWNQWELWQPPRWWCSQWFFTNSWPEFRIPPLWINLEKKLFYFFYENYGLKILHTEKMAVKSRTFFYIFEVGKTKICGSLHCTLYPKFGLVQVTPPFGFTILRKPKCLFFLSTISCVSSSVQFCTDSGRCTHAHHTQRQSTFAKTFGMISGWKCWANVIFVHMDYGIYEYMRTYII